MPLASPRAPFDAWPVQLADEGAGLHAWFLPPAAVVFQYRLERFDAAQARLMVGLIDQVLATHRPSIRAAGGLLMVHDLRAITDVSWEAQRILRAAWPNMQTADARASVLAGLRVNLFLYNVARTISVAARFFTGISLTLVPTIDECVATYGLTAPGADVQFPAQARAASSG